MGTVNYETRTFTTDGGIVLKLKPVNYMLLARLETDISDRPNPPLVEVEIAKRKQWIENYDDPAYVKRLQDWRGQKNMNELAMVLILGVDISDHLSEIDAWAAEYADLFNAKNERDQAVNWLLFITTQEEAQQLSEAITSQTMVTGEGLKEAAATFPGSDQRQ